MNVYEKNKKLLPNLDNFATAKNHILRDMYKQAIRKRLSDKQIAFAQKLWDQEQNGGRMYDNNKKRLPMIDGFKEARNFILRDFWNKAHQWQLSDKQIQFALKLWSQEQQPLVKLGVEEAEFLRNVAYKYLPNNYYNSTGAYVGKLISPIMEQEDFDKVLAQFHKYRKSLFDKVFK